MKKNIFFSLFLVFFSLSYSNSLRSVDERQIKEKKGVVYFLNETTPFSGKVISNKDRSYYLNGKPHGKWLTFYPNGNLRSIENWKNGKLCGKYILYQSNGLKIMETSYSNGKDNGIYKLFHKNGALQVSGRFSNGIPKGIWKYYNSKNKLIGKAEYPE